ncbi:Transcription initiation factor TFIID subunit 8 [Spathaspora sp. JA1]|nr:Transcription initiation factor TFIID subunit 8 [Spathaspora sp. JA1]
MTSISINTGNVQNGTESNGLIRIQEEASPMDFALEKVIAIVLQSKQYRHCARDFLDELTDLTIRFLNDLVNSLSQYTRLQRRQKPSISDMKLLFNLKGISLDELIEEINHSRKFQRIDQGLVDELKQVKSQIINAQAERENPEIEENNPSLPFIVNEQYEITNLVPRLNPKPNYVPGYLPDFPPDYTYQSTPKYMQTITDLKELRLKLVSESRMIEKPLYNLIESDDKKWRIKFEQELSDFDQGKKNEVDVTVHVPLEENKEPIIPPPPPQQEQNNEGEQPTKPESENKSFDFIKYAQKRKSIVERQQQDHEARVKARETNLFMKAELYYSPYSSISPTPEIETYFKNVISDGFKDVISSVRKAEQEKKERIQKLVEERAKRERELEAQRKANEISITFNRMEESSSSEDEDEDSDKVLEFMFDEDNEQQPEPNVVIVAGEQEHTPHVPLETTNNDVSSFPEIEADESSDDDMEDIEAILEAEITTEDNKVTETGDVPETTTTLTTTKSSDEDISDDDMEDIL